MSLTVRADCPACGEPFRVPLVATLTAANDAVLSINPQVMKDLFDTHAAEAPELHGGGE